MPIHDIKERGQVTCFGDGLPGSRPKHEVAVATSAFITIWDLIAQAVHVNAVDKGFWDDEIQGQKLVERLISRATTLPSEREMLRRMARRNTGEILALIQSEVSEALEGDRKPHPDKHCPEFDNLAVELADAVIRIMEFGYARDIPVAQALIAKTEANARRDFKHGGKKY